MCILYNFLFIIRLREWGEGAKEEGRVGVRKKKDGFVIYLLYFHKVNIYLFFFHAVINNYATSCDTYFIKRCHKTKIFFFFLFYNYNI